MHWQVTVITDNPPLLPMTGNDKQKGASVVSMCAKPFTRDLHHLYCLINIAETKLTGIQGIKIKMIRYKIQGTECIIDLLHLRTYNYVTNCITKSTWNEHSCFCHVSCHQATGDILHIFVYRSYHMCHTMFWHIIQSYKKAPRCIWCSFIYLWSACLR